MRRILILIIAFVMAAACARLFWLKEIAEAPTIAAQLKSTAVIAAGGFLLWVMGVFKDIFGGRTSGGTKAAPRTPAAAQKPASLRQKSNASDLDDMIAEMESMSGEADRPAKLPAWALVLRSPFGPQRPVTSWIGGLPFAPAGFDWPRDESGKPLHFLAQIDLSALTREARTGARPRGLPEQGALLVFVGHLTYQVRLIDSDGVAQGQSHPVPGDLPDITELGFWPKTHVFHHWPVDPAGYLDDGTQVKTTPQDPASWLTTWGLAAFEVKAAIEAMHNDTRQRERYEARLKRRDPNTAMTVFMVEEAKHHELMAEQGPGMLADLLAFEALAKSMPPEDPVDQAKLAEIMSRRQALSDGLPNYAVKFALQANPGTVEEALLGQYFDTNTGRGLENAPPAYHSFLERRITGWRGHRLFGRALPETTDVPDIRGLDCLISILGDRLLGTQSEHEDGMSIWCDSDALGRGDFRKGKYVPHTTV